MGHKHKFKFLGNVVYPDSVQVYAFRCPHCGVDFRIQKGAFWSIGGLL